MRQAPLGDAPVADRPGRAAARAKRPARLAGWPAELALVAGLLLVATVSRPLGYLFSHSFWLDEGWVADSVRAPLRQLRLLTSSTPIGWTLLLRLVPPVGPPERLRVLPLAFAVAAAVPAYLLGRRLGRVQAVVAGLAAAVAPGAIAYDDLKQYTADAFVTVLLVWLAARVDADWTPRRVADLGAACVPAVFVSHATVFASAAVVGALALRCLAERRWDRLARVAGLGLALAAVEGAVYLAFLSVGDNQAMQRWWARDYIPLAAGPGRAVAFAGARLAAVLGRTGFGPWPLALALVLAGLAALWRAGLRATALAAPILLLELVVAGGAGRYPFMDARTSLFVTVLLTVVAGLGLGGLAAWAAGRWRAAGLALAAVLVAAALLPLSGRQDLGRHMPGSSLRQQVAFVLAHRRPGDVVVVSRNASFPFAYYWPDRPAFTPETTGSAVLFQVEYRDRPELVVEHRRSQADADAAVRAATALTRSGRVWLVLAEAGDGGPIWPRAAPTARRVNGGSLPLLLRVGSAGG
jgi:hypothetical protein